MLIENRIRGTIISSSAVEAKGFFQKTFGLILYRSTLSGIPTMCFRTRFGVHTFFLKDSIDVLILDSKNRVVDMNSYMKPWRIFIWDPKYSFVVELPAGRIGESKTRIGDQLDLM